MMSSVPSAPGNGAWYTPPEPVAAPAPSTPATLPYAGFTNPVPIPSSNLGEEGTHEPSARPCLVQGHPAPIDVDQIPCPEDEGHVAVPRFSPAPEDGGGPLSRAKRLVKRIGVKRRS